MRGDEPASALPTTGEPAHPAVAGHEPAGAGPAMGAASPGANPDGASGVPAGAAHRPQGSGAPSAAPSNRLRRRQARKTQTLGAFVRELLVLVVIAIVLALVFKTFVVQAFWIPSGSMEPTLMINDRVLVEKLSYRFGTIHEGDIVVFVHNEGGSPAPAGNLITRLFSDLGQAVGIAQPSSKDFIKRVIGLPGDHLFCRGGHVYRNGAELSEPYLPPGTYTACSPVTVPAGMIFVMGDNREDSEDSRVFGPVPESAVVGHAFMRIWPPSRIAILHS